MSQQINLLTADLRPSRQLLTAGRVGVAALVLLLALVLGGAWLASETASRERRSGEQQGQLKVAKEQLAALGKELAARKPDEKLAAELQAAQVQLRGREEVLAYLERGSLGSSAGFAQYLRAIARQTPNGLWLTAFGVAEGGRDMDIRGRMLQPAALPEYIRRLNGEPAFQGRSFASLDIRRAELDAPDKGKPAAAAAAAKYVEFALTATLSPPSQEKRP